MLDNGWAVGYYTRRFWACSSAGRALQSHCRGQGFESPQVHYASLCRLAFNITVIR